MQNNELLFEIDRENKIKWTEERFRAMSEDQKVRLLELVYYMNPEIKELSPTVRDKWIKILSGVYIRYVLKCPVEDYNTPSWKKKAQKISTFDTSILEKQQ